MRIIFRPSFTRMSWCFSMNRTEEQYRKRSFSNNIYDPVLIFTTGFKVKVSVSTTIFAPDPIWEHFLILRLVSLTFFGLIGQKQKQRIEWQEMRYSGLKKNVCANRAGERRKETHEEKRKNDGKSKHKRNIFHSVTNRLPMANAFRFITLQQRILVKCIECFRFLSLFPCSSWVALAKSACKFSSFFSCERSGKWIFILSLFSFAIFFGAYSLFLSAISFDFAPNER